MEFQTRKEKLVALRDYLDLETNTLKSETSETELYQKTIDKNQLDKRIDKCRKCYNLNVRNYTKSIPGWGNLNADIFFIGESPCKNSMISKMPFAWASGNILDIVLKLSSLIRYDIFISNSVHCHLETKRVPTDKERFKCRKYLLAEIELINPKLIVTMGNSAKASLAYISKTLDCKVLNKVHPAKFLYSSTGLRDYILKFSLELDRVSK